MIESEPTIPKETFLEKITRQDLMLGAGEFVLGVALLGEEVIPFCVSAGLIMAGVVTVTKAMERKDDAYIQGLAFGAGIGIAGEIINLGGPFLK